MNNTTNTIDTRPLMVSIRCITYNHEPFIRQCLDGFVMQKTNFRFEAIVHDDASTDGTAAIIREYAEKYPDIIKPIFETENQYSKHDGSLDRIMDEACTGKYIAICEGDDYWTDPLKLQKQFDVLESDEKIQMVYTNFNTIDHLGNPITRDFHEDCKKQSKKQPQFFYLLTNWNFIITATVMVKKEIFANKIFRFCPVHFDYPIFLTAASQGIIYYLEDITATYRKNPTSLMNNEKSRNVINNGIWEAKRYFIGCYLRKEIPSFLTVEDSYLKKYGAKLAWLNRKNDCYKYVKKYVNANKNMIYYFMVEIIGDVKNRITKRLLLFR